jgi:hypothetical protein
MPFLSVATALIVAIMNHAETLKDLLSNPEKNPLPTDFEHPPLSTFQKRSAEPTVRREVTAYHPDIDASYRNGIGIDLTSHPDLIETFASVIPATHPNIMDMLSNPRRNPLPTDFEHPTLSRFQKRTDEPDVKREVTFYHPEIDSEYKRGTGVDVSKHPDLQATFDPYLPATHPKIMDMLQDPLNNPLPDFHPTLSNFQTRLEQPVVQRKVSFYHPSIDYQYRQGVGIDPDTHPNLTDTFAQAVPSTHPVIMDMLANPAANPLPASLLAFWRHILHLKMIICIPTRLLA